MVIILICQNVSCRHNNDDGHLRPQGYSSERGRHVIAHPLRACRRISVAFSYRRTSAPPDPLKGSDVNRVVGKCSSEDYSGSRRHASRDAFGPTPSLGQASEETFSFSQRLLKVSCPSLIQEVAVAGIRDKVYLTTSARLARSRVLHAPLLALTISVTVSAGAALLHPGHKRRPPSRLRSQAVASASWFLQGYTH